MPRGRPRSFESSLAEGARAHSSWALKALAVLWLATLTVTMQWWVGGSTIYSPDVAARVESAHAMILANAPPPGETWNAQGMNGANVRLGAVLAGEAIHRATGLSVTQSYLLLDSAMLLLGLGLLLRYLLRIEHPLLAILAVTWVGTVLPLTYQLFYFHPWDRLSLVAWVTIISLLFAQRLWAVALVLPFAVLIKYDIMLLPGLHGLQMLVRERSLRVRDVAVTGALLAIGIGTYLLLLTLRPGGNEPRVATELMARSFEVLRELSFRWPPFLGFALPLTLAVIGVRAASAWARASFIFGLLLAVPFVLQTHLAEFRAHMPILVLILPAALRGLRVVLEGSGVGIGAAPIGSAESRVHL
jgi:hypothetical protein